MNQEKNVWFLLSLHAKLISKGEITGFSNHYAYNQRWVKKNKVAKLIVKR